MDITIDTIQTLVDLATEKNLSELTLEQDDQKLTIKTALAAAVAPMPMVQPAQVSITAPQGSAAAPAEAAKAAEAPAANNYYKVTAPMVGTFYRAPSPESPAFVEVGSTVSKGQTLCIIEAMKLMNELESEVSGVVRRIVAENGSPVEFGQVLMEIEVQ